MLLRTEFEGAASPHLASTDARTKLLSAQYFNHSEYSDIESVDWPLQRGGEKSRRTLTADDRRTRSAAG